MALLRKDKEQLVSQLSADLSSQPAVAVLAFTRMSVEEATALRRNIREMGGGMRVVKKRLLARISPEIGMGELPSGTEGSVAIAWSNELLAPAKAFHEFVGAHKEDAHIVAGMLHGEALSADDVRALATLPSEQELRGSLVGVLAGTLRGFVGVLSGTLRGLPAVLAAHADNKKPAAS